MKSFINYGGGVNSTAILALICKGEIDYKNQFITFADTGAEHPDTYDYVSYLNKKLQEFSMQIITVKSKEGSLYYYCLNKKILPMRNLRWCTDRWKRKPLTEFRDIQLDGEDDFKVVIGIDHGEKHRAMRWMNDEHSDFPLIDRKHNRQDCIQIIKEMGWKIPRKSGCWFCPYAKMKDFKELKINNPLLFNKLCELETLTLNRLVNSKMLGWFDQTRPLNKAVEHKYPETNKDQTGLCMYCEV
jgi:hypothetical protein